MKRFFTLFTLILSLFLFVSPSYAFKKETFINFVFPIREILPTDGLPFSTLDLPIAITEEATKAATPITWLLDYKVLNSPLSLSYFQKLAKETNHEIGALLEVDRSLLGKLSFSAEYSQTMNYLNSYTPRDRIKLINTYMELFFKSFGFYPKSVGGTYLDSFSLEYLQKKYSVTAATYGITPLDSVPPSLITPFTHFPYFPHQNNALVPSQNRSEKISIGLTYWNPRQAEKRLTDHLIDLSTSPLSEFGQVTVGIDNRSNFAPFLSQFRQYLQFLTTANQSYNFRPLKLGEFGTWFNQRYLATSPAYYLKSVSPFDTDLYYVNPFYQIRLTQTNGQSKITQLTIFNNIEAEDYRQVRNFLPQLSLTNYPLISGNPLDIDFNLKTAQIGVEKGLWHLDLSDQEQFINLESQGITTNIDFILPPHPAISKKIDSSQTTFSFNSNWAPYFHSRLSFLFDLAKFIALVLIVLYFLGLTPKRVATIAKGNIAVTLTILFGSLVWMLTMWQSGQLNSFGLTLFGAHSHDALVHFSLIESFAREPLSLANPNLYSHQLQNYHFLYDYFLGLLTWATSISSLDLYFRFVPAVISILVGLFSAILLRRLKFTTSAISVSLLAVYLMGSLGFIPSLISGHGPFGGESTFWMTQSVTTLVNPPFALSLTILLGFLILFDRWINALTLRRTAVLSLLAGLLIQIKAYASILLLISLGLLFLLSLLRSPKRTRSLSVILFSSVALTLLFFLPTYNAGSSLFIFSPLWFIKALFAAEDRLFIPYFASAWQNYLLSGNYLKLIFLQSIGLFLYLVGNLGLRLLALPRLASLIKEKDTAKIIFFITIVGLIVPLIFIQSGNSWNSIQFSYYSLFFLNLLIGPVIISLLSRCRNLLQLSLLTAAFIIFALSTTVGSLRNYTSFSPSTFIPYPQLRQLDILRRSAPGLVLSPSYQQQRAKPLVTPKPLFAFDSTSYVTALTGQPVYFADNVNLEISNYDYQEQQTLNQRFFLTDSQIFAKNFLKDTPLNYILIDPFSVPKFDLGQLGFSPIFDAGPYKLYSRNKP